MILAIKVGIPSGYTEYNFFVIPLIALLMVCLCSNDFGDLGKIQKRIIYVSNLTYAFFLAQFFIWEPVQIVARCLGINSSWAKVLMAFVLCVGISIMLYEIVEKRIKKFLKYLGREKSNEWKDVCT